MAILLNLVKTVVIDMESTRDRHVDINIVSLQETKHADGGSPNEQRYTFLWQGTSSEEKQEHGVDFAVKNSLLAMVKLPTNGPERVITIRLSTHAGLINLDAPTLGLGQQWTR